IDALPPPSVALLEIMACLGGTVGPGLLEAGTGRAAAELEPLLTAPLEDGLLTMTRDGETAIRFRHDRVQQATHDRLAPARGRGVHLSLARRRASYPDFAAMAAEQSLPAVDAVWDPDEVRQVASLFKTAAKAVRLVDPAIAERFLTTAVTSLEKLA